MTQLPLSNIPTGDGMACISPHRGEHEFFVSSAWGCASHSEASHFVLELLKYMDVFSTRSEVGFIK
jgi:hypothetical protein